MTSELERIFEKYPGRVPVYVSKGAKSKLADVEKHKYLVPCEMTVGQFIYVLRKHIKLKAEQGIFIFVNNKLPPTSMMMGELYGRDKGDDKLLHIVYSEENVFG